MNSEPLPNSEPVLQKLADNSIIQSDIPSLIDSLNSVSVFLLGFYFLYSQQQLN